MKRRVYFSLAAAAFGLLACNIGTSPDNGISISFSSTSACQSLTPGNACAVVATYSASSSSSYIGQSLNVSVPQSGYAPTSNCGSQQISTTVQRCTITVSCNQGISFCPAGKAYVYPSSQVTTYASFPSFTLG